MSQTTTPRQTSMRALVKREAGKGIWMEQVPVPAPGPNEVLIKLEKTAICGTDLHIYLWDEWSQRTIKPGLVIGHEFVGRVVGLVPRRARQRHNCLQDEPASRGPEVLSNPSDALTGLNPGTKRRVSSA